MYCHVTGEAVYRRKNSWVSLASNRFWFSPRISDEMAECVQVVSVGKTGGEVTDRENLPARLHTLALGRPGFVSISRIHTNLKFIAQFVLTSRQ